MYLLCHMFLVIICVCVEIVDFSDGFPISTSSDTGSAVSWIIPVVISLVSALLVVTALVMDSCCFHWCKDVRDWWRKKYGGFENFTDTSDAEAAASVIAPEGIENPLSGAGEAAVILVPPEPLVLRTPPRQPLPHVVDLLPHIDDDLPHANNNLPLEDNNNGPISPQELENIENNNATTYIVSENEDRNSLSPEIRAREAAARPLPEREVRVETREVRAERVQIESPPVAGPSHSEPIRAITSISDGVTLSCDNLEEYRDWFSSPLDDFPRNNLKYLREIGTGWFGTIIEAEGRFSPDPGQTTRVAVKVLKQNVTLKEKRIFLSEATICRDVKHQNVLRLLGRNLSEEPWLMIFELCPLGDLKHYLIVNEPKMATLNENGVPLRLQNEVADALAYIHSSGLVHTDIACRTVLVSCDQTSGRVSARLCDYGDAVSRCPTEYCTSGSLALPVRWCAPEALRTTHTDIVPNRLEPPADVWSLGVLLWEVCSWGQFPYQEVDNDAVVTALATALQSGIFPLVLPEPAVPCPYRNHLYQIMQMCWSVDPSKRPSASHVRDLISHLLRNHSELQSSSVDDFENRWHILKPNNIPVVDEHVVKDTSLQASPLNKYPVKNAEENPPRDLKVVSIHQNTEKSPKKQFWFSKESKVDDPNSIEMAPWLKNVPITCQEDISYMENVSNVISDLDNILSSEKTSSSESSHQASPLRDGVPTTSKQQLHEPVPLTAAIPEELSSPNQSPFHRISDKAEESPEALINPPLDFRLGYDSLSNTKPHPILESDQKQSSFSNLFDSMLKSSFNPSLITSAKYGYDDKSGFYDTQRVYYSSGSETEDETWKKRVEMGVLTEKVKMKSKSVTDLMVLTHIDTMDLDSDSTPLNSLDFRINIVDPEIIGIKNDINGTQIQMQTKHEKMFKRNFSLVPEWRGSESLRPEIDLWKVKRDAANWRLKTLRPVVSLGNLLQLGKSSTIQDLQEFKAKMDVFFHCANAKNKLLPKNIEHKSFNTTLNKSKSTKSNSDLDDSLNSTAYMDFPDETIFFQTNDFRPIKGISVDNKVNNSALKDIQPNNIDKSESPSSEQCLSDSKSDSLLKNSTIEVIRDYSLHPELAISADGSLSTRINANEEQLKNNVQISAGDIGDVLKNPNATTHNTAHLKSNVNKTHFSNNPSTENKVSLISSQSDEKKLVQNENNFKQEVILFLESEAGLQINQEQPIMLDSPNVNYFTEVSKYTDPSDNYKDIIPDEIHSQENCISNLSIINKESHNINNLKCVNVNKIMSHKNYASEFVEQSKENARLDSKTYQSMSDPDSKIQNGDIILDNGNISNEISALKNGTFEIVEPSPTKSERNLEKFNLNLIPAAESVSLDSTSYLEIQDMNSNALNVDLETLAILPDPSKNNEGFVDSTNVREIMENDNLPYSTEDFKLTPNFKLNGHVSPRQSSYNLIKLEQRSVSDIVLQEAQRVNSETDMFPMQPDSSVIIGPFEDCTLELYSGLKTDTDRLYPDSLEEEEALAFSSNFVALNCEIRQNAAKSLNPLINIEHQDKAINSPLDGLRFYEPVAQSSPLEFDNIPYNNLDLIQQQFTTKLAIAENENNMNIEYSSPAFLNEARAEDSSFHDETLQSERSTNASPISLSENSYREGFELDDEHVKILRNELELKLPLAQAYNEHIMGELSDDSEGELVHQDPYENTSDGAVHDHFINSFNGALEMKCSEDIISKGNQASQALNEVFIEYSNYPVALSPIVEETFSDISEYNQKIVAEQQRQEPSTSSGIRHNVPSSRPSELSKKCSEKSQNQGKSTTIDSWCSNDTLFNVEDNFDDYLPTSNRETPVADQPSEISLTPLPPAPEDPDSQSTYLVEERFVDSQYPTEIARDSEQTALGDVQDRTIGSTSGTYPMDDNENRTYIIDSKDNKCESGINSDMTQGASVFQTDSAPYRQVEKMRDMAVKMISLPLERVDSVHCADMFIDSQFEFLDLDDGHDALKPICDNNPIKESISSINKSKESGDVCVEGNNLIADVGSYGDFQLLANTTEQDLASTPSNSFDQFETSASAKAQDTASRSAHGAREDPNTESNCSSTACSDAEVLAGMSMGYLNFVNSAVTKAQNSEDCLSESSSRVKEHSNEDHAISKTNMAQNTDFDGCFPRTSTESNLSYILNGQIYSPINISPIANNNIITPETECPNFQLNTDVSFENKTFDSHSKLTEILEVSLSPNILDCGFIDSSNGESTMSEHNVVDGTSADINERSSPIIDRKEATPEPIKPDNINVSQLIEFEREMVVGCTENASSMEVSNSDPKQSDHMNQSMESHSGEMSSKDSTSKSSQFHSAASGMFLPKERDASSSVAEYFSCLNSNSFPAPVSSDDFMSTSFNQESPTDEQPNLPEESVFTKDALQNVESGKDWESETDDTHSNSSEDFVWKERRSSYLKETAVEAIAEECTDDEYDDDEEVENDFTPSSWNCNAMPSKSSMKSPETSHSETKKHVAFKEEKYQNIYEYPREANTPDEDLDPCIAYFQPDYSTYSDWKDHSDGNELVGNEHLINPLAINYQYTMPLSSLLNMTSLQMPEAFFISSSERPFESYDLINSTSQFFPGQSLTETAEVIPESEVIITEVDPRVVEEASKMDEEEVSSAALGFTTPDSGMEDITPVSTLDYVVNKENIKNTEVANVELDSTITETKGDETNGRPSSRPRQFAGSLILPDPASSGGSQTSPHSLSSSGSNSPLSPHTLGGLRHTRDKLKLDLPPSPLNKNSPSVIGADFVNVTK